MLNDKVKETAVSAVITAVTGLLGYLWHALTDKRGIPEWVGYLALGTVAGIGLAAIWGLGRFRSRLSEDERYVLAHLSRAHGLIIPQCSNSPDCLITGSTLWFGTGERPGAPAPVAIRYMEAVERLEQRGYVRLHEAGIMRQSTTRGLTAATKLPKRYFDLPQDVRPLKFPENEP